MVPRSSAIIFLALDAERLKIVWETFEKLASVSFENFGLTLFGA